MFRPNHIFCGQQKTRFRMETRLADLTRQPATVNHSRPSAGQCPREFPRQIRQPSMNHCERGTVDEGCGEVCEEFGSRINALRVSVEREKVCYLRLKN